MPIDIKFYPELINNTYKNKLQFSLFRAKKFKINKIILTRNNFSNILQFYSLLRPLLLNMPRQKKCFIVESRFPAAFYIWLLLFKNCFSACTMVDNKFLGLIADMVSLGTYREKVDCWPFLWICNHGGSSVLRNVTPLTIPVVKIRNR